jgi:Ca-activated chloride channel family protein
MTYLWKPWPIRATAIYAYVDDLDEAQKLFVENLTSTLQVIALDAKIQVDFNPDVVAYYRLIAPIRPDLV